MDADIILDGLKEKIEDLLDNYGDDVSEGFVTGGGDVYDAAKNITYLVMGVTDEDQATKDYVAKEIGGYISQALLDKMGELFFAQDSFDNFLTERARRSCLTADQIRSYYKANSLAHEIEELNKGISTVSEFYSTYKGFERIFDANSPGEATKALCDLCGGLVKYVPTGGYVYKQALIHYLFFRH